MTKLSRCMFWALLFVFFSLPDISFAQREELLVLDESSFQGVNIDAVTGLNIDKIGLDRSNRPCARLKIHINRMTTDDIGFLELKVLGGNVIIMKRKVSDEGNGLIVELTARRGTRFYLHHPKFGDSNPVTVDLEGNKEYRIEASCEQRYSINVKCGQTEADVYLDHQYQGAISSQHIITIPDVLPGPHTIEIRNGGTVVVTKDIEVASDKIYFELETADKEFNYVFFHVTPSSAEVMIGGLSLPRDAQGRPNMPLAAGKYRYKVFSEGYRTEETEFEFDAQASKVITVNLKPFKRIGSLEIHSVPEKAKIYIDGKHYGHTPRTIFDILEGEHLVELFAKDKYVKSIVTVHEGEVSHLSETLQRAPSLWKGIRPGNFWRMYTYIMLHGGYSFGVNPNIGLSVGQLSMIGWYVRGTMTTSWPQTTMAACDETGRVFDKNMGVSYIPPYSGRRINFRASALGGMNIRLGVPLYIQLGAGYGRNIVEWELVNDGGWVYNQDLSYTTIVYDFGLMLQFNHVAISVSTTFFNNFEDIDAGIGIAYVF